MDAYKDRIELALPLKPQYVSVARLTVSGIASRLGFDIDTVEDIKVAVAEVCNKIVSAADGSPEGYKIVFCLKETGLEIKFHSGAKGLDHLFGDPEDELGISIIKAFMDSVEFSPDQAFILSMSKSVERA